MTSRREKVAALAAAATIPGERAAAEAASARLAAKVVPYVAPSLESEVEAILCNLGYRLIPNTENRPGARFVESDDGMHRLIEHLRAVTSMSELPEPAAWFNRLLAGRRIQLPERHPSGFASQEAPHTRVSPLSAGTHTPARNTK